MANDGSQHMESKTKMGSQPPKHGSTVCLNTAYLQTSNIENLKCTRMLPSLRNGKQHTIVAIKSYEISSVP